MLLLGHDSQVVGARRLTVSIRKYEPTDAPRILVLAEKFASWDATPTEADIAGYWSSDPDLFLVADVDGQVAGFIVAAESRNMPDEVLRNRGATKAGSIEILAVAEEHRRRGIATELLNQLFDTFKTRGVDYVSLHVPAQEAGARKLYAKIGFRESAYFLSKKL